MTTREQKLEAALTSLYALVKGECPRLLEDDHHDTIVRQALAEPNDEWISVKTRLPEANQRVRIKAIPKHPAEEAEAVFVTMSDGDYCWDNKVDHIWQSYEVSHWKPAAPKPETK